MVSILYASGTPLLSHYKLSTPQRIMNKGEQYISSQQKNYIYIQSFFVEQLETRIPMEAPITFTAGVSVAFFANSSLTNCTGAGQCQTPSSLISSATLNILAGRHLLWDYLVWNAAVRCLQHGAEIIFVVPPHPLRQRHQPYTNPTFRAFAIRGQYQFFT